MAMQMESTPRPNESRANSHSQNAEAQPEIDSGAAIKVTRQDVESLTDEQRRELIATIWREIYGPLTVGPISQTLNATGEPIGEAGQQLQRAFPHFADDLAWWTEAAKCQRARKAPPY
jgi:hypothetical protein